MKNYVLFFLFLAYSASAQEILFIGSKSYPCTETFELKSPETIGGIDLDVCIAKSDEGGYIVLSCDTWMSHKYIGGNIQILLADQSFIKCIDRGIRDKVNNVSTTIYKLTKDEFIRLSKVNIYSIRFSLKADDGFVAETDDYSVVNSPDVDRYLKRKVINIPLKVKNLLESY